MVFKVLKLNMKWACKIFVCVNSQGHGMRWPFDLLLCFALFRRDTEEINKDIRYSDIDWTVLPPEHNSRILPLCRLVILEACFILLIHAFVCIIRRNTWL